MTLFRLAGFRALRITSYWTPGEKPRENETRVLANVAGAAQPSGVRLYVTVMHPGSGTTPLTDEARAEFASYAAAIVREVPAIGHVIIANEPNLNRFWLPQFNPDGSSAAPAAYLALLARTYDAMKAVSPERDGVRRRRLSTGHGSADGIRPTHSPTRFIQELGSAYRASGRDRPIMDVFTIHVYGDNSSQSRPDRAPARHVHRRRRLRQARPAAGRGVRRHRAARFLAADSLRRVRRRVRDPECEGESLHRQRADDDAAGGRGNPGRVLRAGPGVGVLPAERHRVLLFLRTTSPPSRAGSRESATQTGRRRAAQTRDPGARSHRRRLDLAVPGHPARRPYVSASLRIAHGGKRGVFRTSLRCTSTASTRFGS